MKEQENSRGEQLRKALSYTKKNGYDRVDRAELEVMDAYCTGYKQFLDAGKTERECVDQTIALAEAADFRAYQRGMELKPGDKVYRANRGKAVMLAVMGRRGLDQGVNIAAAHIDSPRLDLKQNPLYEADELAFLKTHYYGGLRKYQWVTIPLELHGVVVLKSGQAVRVSVGNGEGDPLFTVDDLLPHLGAEQSRKPLGEAIPAESLNILVGSRPLADDEGSDRVKLSILELLNRKYGIVEEDFISAELSAVPAFRASDVGFDRSLEGSDRVKLSILELLNRKYGIVEEDFISAELSAVPAFRASDVGFDRSLIGAYGHDDRVCAYASLAAILQLNDPERTAVCMLADKEEIGSEGVTGMKSAAFDTFIEDLCQSQNVPLRACYERSFCLSADVTAAYDPNFAEVYEKRNSALVNCGMGLCKYTGARGKSGASDASAELVAYVRGVLDRADVVWQMAELGKVDVGGGGTVAMFMAERNIDTLDAGVPVLSMHSPFETVGKLDCYMTFKGVKAIYEAK